MYLYKYFILILCTFQGKINQYPNPQVPFYQKQHDFFDDCDEISPEQEFEKSLVNFDPFFDDTKNANAFYDDCIDNNIDSNKKQKDKQSYSESSSREESSKDNIANEISSVDQHDINKLKRKDVYYVIEKGKMYPSLGPFENDKRSPIYHPIVNKIQKEDRVVNDKEARIDPKFMTKLANGGWYERKTIKPMNEKGADVYVERIGFWPGGKQSKRKHKQKYYSQGHPQNKFSRKEKPKEKRLSKSIAQMGYPFTDVPDTRQHNSSRNYNDERSQESSDHQNSREYNSRPRGYLPGEPKYLRDEHRNSNDENSSDSFSQSGYPHAGGFNNRARGYLQGEVKHLKDEQVKAMEEFDKRTDDLKKKKDAAMRKARNVIRANNMAKMQDRLNKKKNKHMGEAAKQYADVKANAAANLGMLSMVPGPAAAKARARQLKNKMKKGFGKLGSKMR